MAFGGSFLSLKPSLGMVGNAVKFSRAFFLDDFKPDVNHSPLSIGLYITYKCNIDCPFCWNPHINEKDFISQDMSVEEIEKILDHPRLKQAFRVSFVGGEPLAHKDIFNMIELCKKKKKLTMIPSNGLLIPKRIDDFKKSSLTSLQISLYDGHIDEQLENIRLLQKVNSNITLSIARYVTTEKKSYLSMEDFIKMADENDIQHICFQNFVAKDEKDIHLAIFDDHKEILDHFDYLRSKYSNRFNITFPSPLKRNNDERFCYDLYTVIFVGKNGHVAPCSSITPPSEKFGNIWQDEFWNNKYFYSHRKNFNKNFPFHPTCKFCYESSKHERTFI